MTVIILLLLGNIIFNSGGNILIKLGMKRTEGMNLLTIDGIFNGLVLNPQLILGVFSYVASLAFYMFVVKKMDLSIAYPISVSCAIIVVTVVSGLLLKETIAMTQIVGVIIIMLGIYVLTR